MLCVRFESDAHKHKHITQLHVQNRLSSEDYGKHLMSVEDLLQKHALLESDIGVVGERVKSVVDSANQFKEPLEEAGGYRPVEPNVIDERIALLENEYKKLQEAAAQRKGKLFESRRLWNLMADLADEEQWVRETTQLMSSPDLGHDLTSVQVLLNKHKVCLACPSPCLYCSLSVLHHLSWFRFRLSRVLVHAAHRASRTR